MDEFFAIIGVLFVVVLVAQVFQKPEKGRRRRAERATSEANRKGCRANRRPAGNRWRVSPPLVLSAAHHVCRWLRKPLVGGEARVADYLTMACITIAVLVYLIHALIHPETF